SGGSLSSDARDCSEVWRTRFFGGYESAVPGRPGHSGRTSHDSVPGQSEALGRNSLGKNDPGTSVRPDHCAGRVLAGALLPIPYLCYLQLLRTHLDCGRIQALPAARGSWKLIEPGAIL